MQCAIPFKDDPEGVTPAITNLLFAQEFRNWLKVPTLLEHDSRKVLK